MRSPTLTTHIQYTWVTRHTATNLLQLQFSNAKPVKAVRAIQTNCTVSQWLVQTSSHGGKGFGRWSVHKLVLWATHRCYTLSPALQRNPSYLRAPKFTKHFYNHTWRGFDSCSSPVQAGTFLFLNPSVTYSYVPPGLGGGGADPSELLMLWGNIYGRAEYSGTRTEIWGTPACRESPLSLKLS
jgi:hypothetical protein